MSEITAITCAHCGKETRISNAEYNATEDSKTLQLVSVFNNRILMFWCKHCETEYRLPFGG